MSADDLTDEERADHFALLKLQELVFVSSLSHVERAVYSLGGRPIGGWGPMPGVLEIMASITDAETPPIEVKRIVLNYPPDEQKLGGIVATESKTLSKKDLVDRIADKRPDVQKTVIAEVVQLFLDSIGDALVDNQRIELRDFGVFAPKDRAARTARNPKTGEPVNVPPTRVATYKIGKQLKARLAESASK